MGEKSDQRRLNQELASYADVAVVHDLPPIHRYWRDKYFIPRFQTFGFSLPQDMFVSYIWQQCQKRSTCRIVSLGAGNCDSEIAIAQELRRRGADNFVFDCYELNPKMLERGQQEAFANGLAERIRFAKADLNSWRPDKEFDVAFANHSLHHVVELERLFDAVHEGLSDDGVFLTNDMIGRNGHMRWPEALHVVEHLWRDMPLSHKYQHQVRETHHDFVNWDCSREGFEGVRSQDILPELLKRFQFDLFFGFSNVIDVFIDRSYGPNFDPHNEWDRLFIDRVYRTDETLLATGRIKPTHIIAAIMKNGARSKYYEHFTPEFCVRWP